MSGKRQPTGILEANGRKHLTRAEADARRDREVHVPPVDQVTPPAFLTGKKLREEFLEIGGILNAAGLYSRLDQDVLGQYFLCRDRWQKADRKAAAAIRAGDEKLAASWTGIQGNYFKQARQCAEAMGLSVTSRCRIVVPAAIEAAAKASPAHSETGEDEFTARLKQRQAAQSAGAR